MSRDSLVTICKSFIRPRLDYGDAIYDQPNNDSFSDKIEEQLQYKACLAITGAIQATSRECLYNELKDVKVLVAGRVESFVISINYCQLNALSTFSITVFKNKLLCFIRPINCVRIWSHLLEKSLMEKFMFCAFENARRSLPSSSTYQALIHLLKICPVI